MLPKDKDLILQEKVKLYNNIAKINNCEGRLLAELEIYPTPRIIWEFEILGNVQCNFPSLSLDSNTKNPLIGHCFSIEQPICTGDSSNIVGPLRAIRGATAQAVYGDMEDTAHKFIFYLPNTRFQYNSVRQEILIKILKEVGSDTEVSWENGGRYVQSAIDNIWSIRLDIWTDALNWLNPQNRNTGSLITTVGTLYQRKYKPTEPETLSELQTITLSNALEQLKHLCLFLSYANGGYIGPLFIEGYEYTQNRSHPIQTSCAVALTFQTTPLEQLCYSWVTVDSDLKVYMECFPAFKGIMQNPTWRQTYDFTLTQYFQATRPGMRWQVVATAVGAALERLSYTILVEEETNATTKAACELLFDIKQSQTAKQCWNLGKSSGQENISVTGKRLRLLLERIGLTKSKGYDDIDDVPSFLEVRNDAVHPRVGSMTIEHRWKFIKQAIQWIDEVLLWRLGYSSKYLDRTQEWESSTLPRYDLSLRASSW
ncbi:hypothetical protein [Brasilonema bromeliae]|uniref:Apea-like HEPN domain-containing protein n=1 Tax=Brasilonema bromeliae SPC951 TaxID=385972 RepID=A0ABX1PC98_9CYAN|nr:hypothetical protein [Brasilonema bromeliae]NMG22104.1 hypothetical protein [Brasilonema bromeliae SPC951]